MKKKKQATRKIILEPLAEYRHEPGDKVLFTPSQAPGAIPNGTAVLKCNTKPEDSHQDGDPAHVLGSIKHGEDIHYFVEWLDRPGIPVFVMGSKIRRMEN